MTIPVRGERNEQVVAALGRLDAEYRAILVMRDVEGFDYQQMADVLDLPLGTLKSRLFRARLALRDELRPYLSDAKGAAPTTGASPQSPAPGKPGKAAGGSSPSAKPAAKLPRKGGKGSDPSGQ